VIFCWRIGDTLGRHRFRVSNQLSTSRIWGFPPFFWKRLSNAFKLGLSDNQLPPMPLFARESRFTVAMDFPGRLIYCEGNTEFTFPVVEIDREWILIDEPSCKRVRLFFGWYRVPFGFSKAERERLLPRVLQYLKSDGQPARVFDRGDFDSQSFSFFPELFEHRSTASDVLADSGIDWMTSYSSIDPLHEEYGLEVCGIQQKADLEAIGEALRDAFPHWHYCRVCHKDGGREPGWKFAIHMFPRKCGGGRCVDAE
jgi:hypothetical protein